MRKNILHINHQLISSLVKKTDVVCDMTCGNGYDTEFLSNICNHVYSIDIQKIAIEETKFRLKHKSNITYINDSFVNFTNYFSTCNHFIFNLGYLPGKDKKITTKSIDTIKTLRKITLSYPKSEIIIMSYPGHEEGEKELISILEISKTFSNHRTLVTRYHQNQTAPVLIWITPK